MPTMDRQALVDLGAITGNVAALCELVRGSQVMAPRSTRACRSMMGITGS